MDELAKRIKGRVADARSRLTIVRNADRFLSHPDTQNAVSRECGILLLPISSAIELRVRYELTDKASEQNVCYVIDGDMELLPDMQPYKTPLTECFFAFSSSLPRRSKDAFVGGAVPHILSPSCR